MKSLGTGTRIKKSTTGKVRGKIAQPVYAYKATDAGYDHLSSNQCVAVYEVSVAELNAGTFKLGAGPAVPIALAKSSDKCDSKYLVPVYIITGSL